MPSKVIIIHFVWHLCSKYNSMTTEPSYVQTHEYSTWLSVLLSIGHFMSVPIGVSSFCSRTRTCDLLGPPTFYSPHRKKPGLMEANFTLAGLQETEHPGLSSAIDIFTSLLLSQDFVPKSTTSQLSPLQVSSLPYLWVVLGSPCPLCVLSSLFMCSYLLSAYLPLWRQLILCIFWYGFRILSGFVFSLPTPIAPLLCEEVSSADFLPFTSVPYWCCGPWD